MSGILAAFEDLFHQTSFDAATAAAVTVLANTPPPLPLAHLDLAIQAVAPHLSSTECAGWSAALAGALLKAGITAPRCVAAFLGQCSVESAGFRSLEEDLNYNAARIYEVWPTHFLNAAAAAACAGSPEGLANRVYANRMGNGDEASGDGWQFRGRGLIQITGRSTYQRFAQAVNISVQEATTYAGTPAGAAASATWFWTANQLNTLAMTWSIDRLTQKINGGLSAAAERSRLCEAALLVIGT